MIKSKFFEILSTFNKKQLNELGKLIFVNQDDNLTVLYTYLSKILIENFDASLVSKEHILSFVFKSSIDEKKLQKILNEGVKLCEWIILRNELEHNKYYTQLFLADYYEQKNLHKYFSQQLKALRAELQSEKEHINNFYLQYRIEQLQIKHELNFNQRYSEYTDISNYLRTFFETEQLKLKCLSRINLHDSLNEKPIQSILYNQYLSLNKLLTSDKDEDYENQWHNFIKHSNQISEDDLRTIVVIYINICINNINFGRPEFVEHLFNAYTFYMETKIAFETNGLLLPAFYKNFITISLRLGKLDFAYQFAQDYKNYLPEEDKEDVYNYNLAHICFYQQKYEDVLKLLVQSKFTDVFYKLSSRVLQIKTYAELMLLHAKYEDVLESSLNAFKKYIYTNKEINESYATNYKNFYKIFNKTLGITKDGISQLTDEIKLTKPLPEVEWLLSFMKRKYQ